MIRKVFRTSAGQKGAMAKAGKDLQLADFLPYRLSVLSNTISQQIAERYQRDFGLSMSQWRTMAVLGEEEGLSATMLAERTAMDKVAVSRAVAGLVNLGYLRREAVQSDGRRSQLFLSKAGQRVYKRVAAIAVAYEAELTEGMDEHERKALRTLLNTLAKRVSPDKNLW